MNKLELLKQLHNEESDLHNLYSTIADKVSERLRPIFLDIAKDEEDHKEALERIIKEFEDYCGDFDISMDEEKPTDTDEETEAETKPEIIEKSPIIKTNMQI